MNREEYLKQLRNNLASLTMDEQNEAIQYYSDYFEDANDDEKLFAELGTPKELADSIIQKLANGLSKVDAKVEKTEYQENSESRNIKDDGVVFYSYEKSEVKSLKLTFSAAEVVLISGDNFEIETRGLSKECLSVKLLSDGVLVVSNSKRVNFNFWSHERESRIVPRILVTVPNGVELNQFRISLGAGNLESKTLDFKYSEGSFEVGAGNMILNGISGGNTGLRCGMGNLVFNGTLTKRVNIDCGMGSIKMNLNGDVQDYSYDVKVGMGDVRINNEKKSGFGKVLKNEKKQNHISVNCGMGNVNIKIK